MLAGCTSAPTVPFVESVDLTRFIGDWYVIANIPTFIEKGAHNAVERYAGDRRHDRHHVQLQDGSFDGEPKVDRPAASWSTGSNAVWGMQFVWPIKAEYVISYVDPDYHETIITAARGDYVWVMARTPTISAEDFERLRRQVADLGYDVTELQKVPQSW